MLSYADVDSHGAHIQAHVKIERDRQRDRQTERQTDRQTDRQTRAWVRPSIYPCNTRHMQARVEIEAAAGAAVTRECSGGAPVAASEGALREALVQMFPHLAGLHMKGFRVRTLSGASCANAYGAAADAPPSPASASSDAARWGADADDLAGAPSPGVGEDGAGAVRVLVECGDAGGQVWRTMAVSSSVLDAFVLAYCDAVIWRLLQ